MDFKLVMSHSAFSISVNSAPPTVSVSYEGSQHSLSDTALKCIRLISVPENSSKHGMILSVLLHRSLHGCHLPHQQLIAALIVDFHNTNLTLHHFPFSCSPVCK